MACPKSAVMSNAPERSRSRSSTRLSLRSLAIVQVAQQNTIEDIDTRLDELEQTTVTDNYVDEQNQRVNDRVDDLDQEHTALSDRVVDILADVAFINTQMTAIRTGRTMAALSTGGGNALAIVAMQQQLNLVNEVDRMRSDHLTHQAFFTNVMLSLKVV
jgi:hypothetical protein